MTPGTIYDWRVRTNCSLSSSSNSTAQFTTTTPVVCNAPTGLFTTSITSSSATTNWSIVTGAVSYTVDYKATSSAIWINAVTATTSLSRTISGLTASTLYDWRVRTNCSSGSSSYNSIQFTTATPPPTCPGPYDISTNGVISGAATIPFNTDILGTISPTGDQDHYKFVISTGGTITISLTTLPENYELRLLNSLGTILATSANKNNLNETINTTVSAGTYYVRVYPKANPNNSLICYTLRVALGTASLINQNKLEVRSILTSLYPNPAKDKLYINYNFVESAEIKIIDIMGRLLKRQKVNGDHSVLDISILPSGTYVLSIYNNDVQTSLKFIKE